MNTEKRSAHPADHLSTGSMVLSVDSLTGKNFPGPRAPCNGEASSHPGDALVVGLLLILLFAGALLIPFERLMPQEQNGNKSLPSINTDSLPKKKLGGTEGGRCEET